MITALTIVSFLFALFLIKNPNKPKLDFFYDALSVVSVLSFVFCLCTVLVSIFVLGTAHTIDEKIAMYEKENETLEQSVADSVRAYMEYEKETYGNLSNKDAMNLVTVYPELKADELVNKQISIYMDNNRKIKELREKKINLSQYRWNLYFGR